MVGVQRILSCRDGGILANFSSSSVSDSPSPSSSSSSSLSSSSPSLLSAKSWSSRKPNAETVGSSAVHTQYSGLQIKDTIENPFIHFEIPSLLY